MNISINYIKLVVIDSFIIFFTWEVNMIIREQLQEGANNLKVMQLLKLKKQMYA